MKEELAVKNLVEVKEVFDKNAIKFWLDYGTLLGAVRDGKIIEWDSDIDLGTMDDSCEKNASVLSEFEERGFSVSVSTNSKNRKNAVYLDRFGCPVGISLYQVKGKYVSFMAIRSSILSQSLYALHRLLLFNEATSQPKFGFIVKALKHCLSLLPLKLKKPLSDVVLWVWRRIRDIGKIPILVITPKHYFEKLGTIKFYGMTFKIPSDVEDYLKYHYGENWKIPNKKWEYWKEDGAVRILT